MGCEHEHKIATRRVLSSGVVTVAMQCQKCGSGLAVKKSGYDITSLPEFDESIKERYRLEVIEYYKKQAEQFALERQIRSGEWWESYNQYLRSQHWRDVRSIVLRRDPNCQRCFVRSSIQAHHLTYETYNKHGFSFPAECVGICYECHKFIHENETEVA